MTDRSFSRTAELDTAEAATFVTLAGSSRYFAPFLARETSPGAVATELGVDVGSVTYRIRQMLRLGLIRQTRVQRRAGRPIRFYRSTADRVFAPLELTPVSSVRELFRRGLADLDDDLENAVERAWLDVGRHRRWGTHLYRPTPDEGVNRDFVPVTMTGVTDFWEAALAERSPAVWDQHSTLLLTRADAKRLQRELAEVVGRYGGAPSDPGRRHPHLIRLMLAPARRR